MAISSTPKAISTTAHLKRELLFALLGVVLGCVLLPLSIYFIGQLLLGVYTGGTQGFFSFYGDLIRDLAAPQLNSWSIVLGPYVLLSGLRLIFFRGAASQQTPDQKPPPRSLPSKQRKEPTMGS